MRHTFEDASLLQLALTHTSWAHENGGEHNERLEHRILPPVRRGAPLARHVFSTGRNYITVLSTEELI